MASTRSPARRTGAVPASSRRSGTVALVLAVLVSACASQSSAGQRVYGGTDAFRVIEPLMNAWVAAVTDGDVDAAVALYAPDARIRLDYPAQYPELPQAVEEWVDGVQSVLFGPADFDSDGRLVYGMVRVVVVSVDGSRRRGVMTLIVMPSGGRWRIRGQYLALQ